ncbi:sensor histidine kinase [Dinghuibacter silviterrae]|uniref:histidine kinase n=1 Tax=Dinghuibacter silviterrae TaxID=1539049 RepID=A0A4R8DN45_9BACT|nr:HAMP domain-containing sensor histidine kinase [Dinghuibacter silviterrae]TDW99423.1 signal transduction histidine kinase [Dinghuibacter silviterrae]
MKLFTRYNRINALVTLALFLVTCVAMYFLIFQVLVVQLDHNFIRIRNRMQTYVNQHQELPSQQVLDDLSVYYTPTGDSIPGPERFEATHFFDSTLGKDHRFRKYFFPIRVRQSWYQVTLIKPLEGPHHVAYALMGIAVPVILVIILTFSVINRMVLRRLWAPFYKSLEILGRFQLGERNPPVFPETPIEEFSTMNKKLREATGKAADDYKALKEFTENASHEIQTPLAIIRSKLDLVIQDEALSDRQGESLRSAYGAVKKISRLNKSLLLITKIENNQYNRKEDIALDEKLREKLIQFQELWDNSGLTVNASIAPTSIHASPELIDILFDNLLSNATRHNRPGGSLSLVLAQGRLEVSNTGASVRLDRERLFRRFYKESNDSDHVGLGLSIIQQICVATGVAIAYAYADPYHSFILSWSN